jgi:catechol 2,3-dioxygenase-like lactoylglutathione lyase family enzyme
MTDSALPLRIDHITLAVSSLERSGPYYDALLPLLGFRKQSEVIWTDDKGFFFQFFEARPETRPYERYGAGMNHLGFGAPDVAFVERVRDAMAEAGFEVPEIQRFGDVRALFMKDPDGIRFEVSYYPPGAAVVG